MTADNKICCTEFCIGRDEFEAALEASVEDRVCHREYGEGRGENCQPGLEDKGIHLRVIYIITLKLQHEHMLCCKQISRLWQPLGPLNT